MGFPKRGERCKRHRKHDMSKGVCPSCLRERLTRLSSISTYPSSSLSSHTAASMTLESSYSSSSSYSPDSLSSSPSSVASPRHDLEMRKSRSMVVGRFAFRKKERKVGGKEGKKGRFWSKLLVGF